MSEFWSLSGINSPFDPASGNYNDYVWAAIKSKIGKQPDRHYASELGTLDHYDSEHKVGGIRSKRKLNREAKQFAEGSLSNPEIRPRMFRGKRVCVLMVAPKTTLRPPRHNGLRIDVYWSPNDQVPNQRLIHPDSLGYWRKYVRGEGVVWPIENRSGRGIGKGHDFNGFLVHPKIVKRHHVRRRGSHPGRYEWRRTGKTAPDPVALLNHWISDPTIDYVMIAHSQGTNIAMHLLKRGF